MVVMSQLYSHRHKPRPLQGTLGRGLLRPVRAEQSEQTGLFGEGGLKETRALRQRVNRGATAVVSVRRIMCFLNIKACEHPK